MKKEYTNGEITVTWEPEKCIHSTNCWKGLHHVFNPKARPWINMDGARSEEIVAQVNQCPSGALGVFYNVAKGTQNMVTDKVQIEVTPNGPLIIKGAIHLKHSDGKEEQKEKTTALCRCGGSANKPFCDGTHLKNGFKG